MPGEKKSETETEPFRYEGEDHETKTRKIQARAPAVGRKYRFWQCVLLVPVPLSADSLDRNEPRQESLSNSYR